MGQVYHVCSECSNSHEIGQSGCPEVSAAIHNTPEPPYSDLPDGELNSMHSSDGLSGAVSDFTGPVRPSSGADEIQYERYTRNTIPGEDMPFALRRFVFEDDPIPTTSLKGIIIPFIDVVRESVSMPTRVRIKKEPEQSQSYEHAELRHEPQHNECSIFYGIC